MILPSYGKVWNLGSPPIDGILDKPLSVFEKIDGSQLSVGIIEGELRARSRNQDISYDPPKMFAPSLDALKSLPLNPAYIYRGEALAKPKHNALAYERVPMHHFILWDIDLDHQGRRMEWEDVEIEAARLGLECVPCFCRSALLSFEDVQGFLRKRSILGGPIEGIVLKTAKRSIWFGEDGKELMGKYVSASFREKNKVAHDPGKGIIELLCEQYRSPARWAKAVQHRREAGELDLPDIGPLMREIKADLLEECRAEIADRLFKHFWPSIERASVRGFPQWFKEELAKGTFRG